MCKDKLGRAVINKSSMVFDSDKEIMHVDCGPRQGGDRTLVPGAHLEQGQKVHPYNHCVSEKQQRKLSPKKADWKTPWKTNKIGRNHGSPSTITRQLTQQAAKPRPELNKNICIRHRTPGVCILLIDSNRLPPETQPRMWEN